MDLNGDGHLDILSGSYSRTGDGESMAGLFQLLKGSKDGGFKKAEPLTGTDGKPLLIEASEENIIDAICTRPFAVDWNGDGHLDLMVGNFRGTFYLFKGLGKGAFDPSPAIVKAGDKPLAIDGFHSDPFCVDWDGDGDLDIVSGCANGGVQWSENVATKGAAPELTSFKALLEGTNPGRRSGSQFVTEQDVKGPSGSTRVWVADVNGDGKLDLLVGDSIQLVSPARGLTAKESEEKFAAWKKRSEELGEAIEKLGENPAPEAEEAAHRAFGEHYQARSQFLNEEGTGFVWLFVRK